MCEFSYFDGPDTDAAILADHRFDHRGCTEHNRDKKKYTSPKGWQRELRNAVSESYYAGAPVLRRSAERSRWAALAAATALAGWAGWAAAATTVRSAGGGGGGGGGGMERMQRLRVATEAAAVEEEEGGRWRACVCLPERR